MELLLRTALILFVFYIAIFVIYYALISIVSKKRRKFVRNGRYLTSNYNNNIVVIIYAHNVEKNVASLLETLNKQDYPKENYKTYIILDNCSDNSSNTLEMLGGANIFRVGDNYTVGKDESISMLLDRLLPYKNIDAYVFLSADRTIDNDFLSTVNHGLMCHDVLVGSTILKGEPNNITEKILNAYNIYQENIINTSRSILGLSTLINSDCCVIKQNVIEKVQCIDFRDINSELKYSVMLSKLNYKSSFDPNIITYLERDDYKIRKASFSYRISLLKNSLSNLLKSSFLFNEFVLSTIQPSAFALIVFLLFLNWIVCVFNFESKILNSSLVAILSVILALSFIYSLTNSKLKVKEMSYLFLYPIYTLGQLLRKTPVIKQIMDIRDNINHKKHIEKHSIPVMVSAGDKKMKCNIDLVEENGMIRAVFSFKNKKQATDLHLRVFDAIKSISNMLSDKEYEIVDPETKEIVERGQFDLQICQNCKYFTSKIDGTINVIKGICSFDEVTDSDLEKLVMLWQCCENYAPAREKIIEMKNYRK